MPTAVATVTPRSTGVRARWASPRRMATAIGAGWSPAGGATRGRRAMAGRASAASAASASTAPAGPAVAATTPATAGPAMAAVLKLLASSALALASSRSGTSRGIMLV